MARYNIKVPDDPERFAHNRGLIIEIQTSFDEDRVHLLYDLVQALNGIPTMEPIKINDVRYLMRE